jgi:hypothetical protein
MSNEIAWPAAPCCWPDHPAGRCVCSNTERALRAWGDNVPGIMPPMTLEQREYCLAEIDSVEGWKRVDHEADGDSDLAAATLHAWTDFCRDKGLI